jgi:hypothetical protein
MLSAARRFRMAPAVVTPLAIDPDDLHDATNLPIRTIGWKVLVFFLREQ